MSQKRTPPEPRGKREKTDNPEVRGIKKNVPKGLKGHIIHINFMKINIQSLKMNKFK